MQCFNCGQDGHMASRCTWEQDLKLTAERPSIDDMPEIDRCFVCGKPGHYAVACRFHPARLRKIRGAACGPGPCTSACRIGDHNGCGFSWCTCICHEIAL